MCDKWYACMPLLKQNVLETTTRVCATYVYDVHGIVCMYGPMAAQI